jgi:flavin-dependent dehydrogenase
VPEIRARVVIGADGIHAARKGIPIWEGLNRPNQTFTAGVSLELVKVRDIEPDVCEFHAGAFTEKGFTTLWPQDESSCMIHFMSMAEFHQVKEGAYPLSRKLKEAVPVRIAAYSHTSDLGVALPRVVKDGLILTGSSGGWRGILPAIVSGRHAGEVTVGALEYNDTSVERLSAYEGLCRTLAGSKGYLQGHPFYHLPDEKIEELLLQMIERDELTYTRPRPV